MVMVMNKIKQFQLFRFTAYVDFKLQQLFEVSLHFGVQNLTWQPYKFLLLLSV